MPGLRAAPEWAPPTENHFLQSSSLVHSVTYLPGEIDCTTFDSSSTEALHVNFTPLHVTANGVNLSQGSDVPQSAWPCHPTGGVVRIYHTNSTQMNVLSQ